MMGISKKSLLTTTIIIIAFVFVLGALTLTPQQTAYAYNSSNMPKGNNVIAIHDGTKFDAVELKTLATTAGYTDLNAMMSAATESGTAIAETLKGKVVQLGVDRTVGGSALNWAPVYLSRSTDGDAILTLWLATDIYRSSWSDGTYSLDSNAPQSWNDKTIYCDTYDGSFIRHKLNGKTGWTTNWGSTNAEANPNANIGTMVSDFYGNGSLASYITTPANVSWQKNTHKMKNDPNWNGSGSQVIGTKANYPCDWLNDNVWLPSMYEVYDSSIPDDYGSNSFTADGGLWGVAKTGDIVSSTDGAWLRSGYPNHCANPFFLVSYGNHSYGNVFRNIGVRPALHLNLSAVAEAAKPATCEFPSKTYWENAFDNNSALPNRAEITEITFAKTAPDGYTDSGEKLNTNIQIWKKDDTKIAFVYDGTITAPTNCYNLFSNLQNITAINFDNFTTDKVTNMSYMFYKCSGLTSLDLSGFNTASVTNMSGLFYNCSGLQGTFGIDGTAIKISDKFKTDNVKEMGSMFSNCSGLTSLDLFSFHTVSVTNMSYMFYNCNKLQGTFGIDGTAIKISDKFTTDKVTYINSMLYNCSGLTSLDLFGFNTVSVTYMDNMFYNCSGLQGTFGIDGTAIKISDKFKTDNANDMSSMFQSCSGLTSLDLSGFNTANVNDMSYMFYKCSGLTSLDLFGFNTTKVTNMSNMFNNCSSLKTIKVSSSLATKLSTTTDNTYLYYGDRATWYDGNGGTYTNTNRFSTEGTYTTVQPPFEVTVGTAKTYYNLLSAAWNYANTQPFATVKMLADAMVGETLTIDTGKNITLNLNGHKLEHTDASGSVIKVNGTFTLNDSNKTTSHDITSPVTNQSVTIKGGLITGGKGYGDSVIGGAIYVDGGSFTMSGGTLAGNMADYGGGVRVGTNATFIMNENATISHNKATKDGGGICVCGATKVELKGTVSDNAAFAGGGIYYEGNGTHIISGATIKNNTVTTDSGVDYSGNGGGIYVDKCTVTMSSGSISGNSTTKNGGGVYVTSGSTLEMTNGTIFGNMAGSDYYGGGVYVSGTFIMSGGAVFGNKAQDGGGVHVYGGTFTMSDGTINGNNATIYNGGGVEVLDGTFNVSGSVVIKDNVKGGTLDQNAGLYMGGTKNNVYLESVKITVTGALTTGAIIGVYNSGNVATGYNQSEKPSVFFKADDSEKCASANNGTVSIGEHTGGTATCVAAAVCTNCGESYGEVDGSNHTPNADDGNCTTAITCSACGAVTTAAQVSHDFNNSTKYKSDGTHHWKICSRCTVEDTEHKTNCAGGTATCVARATCSTCNNEYGSVNSNNHNPAEDWLIDTVKGKHYHACENGCGNRLGEADHTPGADDGNCTTAIMCSACGAVTTAAQASHSYSDSYTFGDEEHWHVCTHSGCTQTDTPVEHFFQIIVDAAHIKSPASCTALAHYYESCECGAHSTSVFAYGELEPHDFGAWQDGNAATCIATGTIAHKDCNVCHKHFTADNTEIYNLTIAVDSTAHKFGAWRDGRVATCAATGMKGHKDCERCHNYFDDDDAIITDLTIAIDPTAHNLTQHVAKAATCTEKGHGAYETCSRCDHTTYAEVAALGHNLTQHVAKAATCTEKGHGAYEMCSRCDYTTYAEIAALGHDWASEFTVDKQPTVSEKGSKSKHCSRCEEKTEITEIDKLIPALVKPDENGGENQVVITTPDGFTPDIQLVVTQVKQENYDAYQALAQSVNGEVDLVYDVTLQSGGVTVQPDGLLTIRLLIPDNLKDKSFKLFHLHQSTATQMQYTVDGSYAVVTTDKLSEFVFVGEKAATTVADGQTDITALWITLIVVLSAAILMEIGVIVYRGKRKFAAKEKK